MLRKLPYLTLLAILLVGCGDDDNNSNEIVWPLPQHDLQTSNYDLTGTWEITREEIECAGTGGTDEKENQEMAESFESGARLGVLGERRFWTIVLAQEGNYLKTETGEVYATVSGDKVTLKPTSESLPELNSVIRHEGTATDENNISTDLIAELETKIGKKRIFTIRCSNVLTWVRDQS